MLWVDMLLGIIDVRAIPALIAIDADWLTVIATDAHRLLRQKGAECATVGFDRLNER